MRVKQGKQGAKIKQEKNQQNIKRLKLQEDVKDENSDSEHEDMKMHDDVEKDGTVAIDDVGCNDVDDSDEEGDVHEEDEDDNDEVSEGDNDDADDGKEEEKQRDVKLTRKRKALLSPKQEIKKVKLEMSESKDHETLFIRIPSQDMDSSVIKKFFSDHKIEVLEIRRVINKNFVYVDVPSNQMETALELSGNKIAGKEIQIEIAREKSAEGTPKERKPSKNVESQKKTLFVKNLSFELSDDDIKSHFPLASNVFAKRKLNGKLSGYAFLEFESEEIAEKVMAELQNSEIKGRTIALDYVGEKRLNTKPQQKPDENCKTLCVKQLAYTLTKDELAAVFKNSTDIRIVTDPGSGKSKGFGFISFKTHEDASQAMDTMQGKLLKGRNLTISFSRKASENPDRAVSASKSNGKKRNKKRNRKNSKKKSPKKSTGDS